MSGLPAIGLGIIFPSDEDLSAITGSSTEAFRQDEDSEVDTWMNQYEKQSLVAPSPLSVSSKTERSLLSPPQLLSPPAIIDVNQLLTPPRLHREVRRSRSPRSIGTRSGFRKAATDLPASIYRGPGNPLAQLGDDYAGYSSDPAGLSLNTPKREPGPGFEKRMEANSTPRVGRPGPESGSGFGGTEEFDPYIAPLIPSTPTPATPKPSPIPESSAISGTTTFRPIPIAPVLASNIAHEMNFASHPLFAASMALSVFLGVLVVGLATCGWAYRRRVKRSRRDEEQDGEETMPPSPKRSFDFGSIGSERPFNMRRSDTLTSFSLAASDSTVSYPVSILRHPQPTQPPSSPRHITAVAYQTETDCEAKRVSFAKDRIRKAIDQVHRQIDSCPSQYEGCGPECNEPHRLPVLDLTGQSPVARYRMSTFGPLTFPLPYGFSSAGSLPSATQLPMPALLSQTPPPTRSASGNSIYIGTPLDVIEEEDHTVHQSCSDHGQIAVFPAGLELCHGQARAALNESVQSKDGRRLVDVTSTPMLNGESILDENTGTQPGNERSSRDVGSGTTDSSASHPSLASESSESAAPETPRSFKTPLEPLASPSKSRAIPLKHDKMDVGSAADPIDSMHLNDLLSSYGVVHDEPGSAGTPSPKGLCSVRFEDINLEAEDEADEPVLGMYFDDEAEGPSSDSLTPETSKVSTPILLHIPGLSHHGNRGSLVSNLKAKNGMKRSQSSLLKLDRQEGNPSSLNAPPGISSPKGQKGLRNSEYLGGSIFKRGLDIPLEPLPVVIGTHRGEFRFDGLPSFISRGRPTSTYTPPESDTGTDSAITPEFVGSRTVPDAEAVRRISRDGANNPIARFSTASWDQLVCEDFDAYYLGLDYVNTDYEGRSSLDCDERQPEQRASQPIREEDTEGHDVSDDDDVVVEEEEEEEEDFEINHARISFSHYGSDQSHSAFALELEAFPDPADHVPHIRITAH